MGKEYISLEMVLNMKGIGDFGFVKGYGKRVYNNGDTYEGDWINNERDG
jgi:hypothetical protein